MNEPVLFLLGAVALSALGGLIVWVLSRPRREKFGNTIDTFNRDLSALAPPGRNQSRKRRQKRPSDAPPVRRTAPGPRSAQSTPTQPTPARRPQLNGQNNSKAHRPNKVVQTSPRPRPGPRPRQGQ